MTPITHPTRTFLFVGTKTWVHAISPYQSPQVNDSGDPLAGGRRSAPLFEAPARQGLATEAGFGWFELEHVSHNQNLVQKWSTQNYVKN